MRKLYLQASEKGPVQSKSRMLLNFFLDLDSSKNLVSKLVQLFNTLTVSVANHV